MNRRRVRRRLQVALLALAFIGGVLLMLRAPDPRTEPRGSGSWSASGRESSSQRVDSSNSCSRPHADHEPLPERCRGFATLPSAANGSRNPSSFRRPFATEVAPTTFDPAVATASDSAPIAPDDRARLAIVIDDIGWARAAGERVIALSGHLTLAVLPGTPAGEMLSRRAHAAGHEVILHQPMAAHGDAEPGPGALLAEASDDEITRIVAANLDALPHRVGLSNHMGSLLTARQGAMRAVMSAAGSRGVYFLDSRTTADTVAQTTAQALAVPTTRRDLFLDDNLDPERVDAALDAALELAETRGHAVVIGHPHAVTLGVLERRMDEILERVRLVPVSNLLRPTAGRQPVAN